MGAGDGVAIRRTDLQIRRLAISAPLALTAFAITALSQRADIVGLAMVFCVLAAYDVAARAGLAPGWYEALRLQLTVAVVPCLLVATGYGRA